MTPPSGAEVRLARKTPPGGRWRLGLTLLVYNIVLLAALPALALWLVWRTIVRHKPLGSWRHKLGFVPVSPDGAQPRLWLHAVSAGEMSALKPVFEMLRAARPEAHVAISTITPAGMAMAERSCAAAGALFYLPFDWADCVALALWRVRPHLIVVAEKELWPNLLGLARLCGIETLVVNGRVSHRAMARAERLGPLTRWFYRLPSCFCVQSEEDAARLAELGVAADRVVVAGNTKADTLAARDAAAEERLRADLGVRPGAVWLTAGSTHPGEEEIVLDAFRRVREELPEARLLLAPRHLERVPEVCALVAQCRLPVMRRTEGAAADAVVVLDTMGELRSAYAVSTVGFVGGTLVPIGGHNLLEPVAAGKAVVFGPYTENCPDVADLVCSAGVGFRVTSAEDMAGTVLRVAADSGLQERLAGAGQALLESQRGASQRCANIALALLEERER
jgi:3-deoxy-D-manno-octulosonic-acid transferase